MTATIRSRGVRGRTTGWAITEQFAAPLAQLVLTPFLLHRMEAPQFALWVIAQSLVVAAPTLSLGRSVALLSVLPRYGDAERDAHTRVLVRCTLRLVAMLSLAGAAVVLFANEVLARLRPELSSASLYLVLLAAYLALVECEGTLTSALKSYRAFAQTAAIEIAGRATQVTLMLALVQTGAPATEILALVLVATALKLVLKGLVLRRLTGSGKAGHSAPEEAERQIVHVGFWSWVNVISGIAFYSLDRWAVGYFMGSGALAAYSVCNQLAQLTHAVPAAAGQILIPWAAARSSAVSCVDAQDARQLRNVAIAAAGIACLAPLALMALAPQVLSVWIGPAFAAENAALLRHLAFVFLLLTINIPFFYMLVGLGFARYVALLSLLAGSLYGVFVMVIPPQSPVAMADLKLIYAAIGLGFVAKLMHTLKGNTPK